jgi:TRAP-type C4-dicarboxylate transport system permease small subunit
MQGFARLADRAALAAGWLGAIVLLAIMALSMVEVLSRYVFQNPLILSDELGGYAMVAVSFLGLAFCARERGHIRITFLVERLKPVLAGRIRLVTLLIAFAFVCIAAWVSWKFLGDSFTRDMRSNSLLRTPLKWPQMAIPVGFTLYALVLLGQATSAWRDLRAGRPADRFGSDEF